MTTIGGITVLSNIKRVVVGRPVYKKHNRAKYITKRDLIFTKLRSKISREIVVAFQFLNHKILGSNVNSVVDEKVFQVHLKPFLKVMPAEKEKPRQIYYKIELNFTKYFL